MHDRYTTLNTTTSLYEATPTEKWQHKSNTFCGKHRSQACRPWGAGGAMSIADFG